MKRVIYIFIIIITSANAFAYDAEIDGLWYNLNNAKKTAEVTYKDYYNGVYNNNWKYLNVTIPETITYNNNTYTVTSIGDNAFNSCSILKSVYIPNAITSIGNSAFEGCWDLGNISIPDGVISIGNAAFKNCNKFTTISIPNSVTTIGEYVCYGCELLSSLEIGNNVTNIKAYSFTLCNHLVSITLPISITSIESYAFWKCSLLTYVEIPSSTDYICNNAFKACNNLTTVKINSNSILSSPVKIIFGEQVTNYIIGEDVTEIGEFAFQECDALTSIIIPNNIVSIGHGAFFNCTNLREILVEPTNVSFSSIEGVLFNKDQTSLIQYPIGKEGISYSLPNNVIRIMGGAFKDCKNIFSITLNNNLAELEEEAFYQCSGLTSIEIPNNVKSIGWAAFYKCNGIKSIVLGGGTTSIGGFAFGECSNLISMTCKTPNTPTLGENVFYKVNQSSCPLYVPLESVNKYKVAEQWKQFNPIQAIQENEGIDDIINSNANNTKLIREGHVYILRGDKTYTLQGQEVK